MPEIKPSNIFIKGAIPATLIADVVVKHSTKTAIGAHSIFLGQVRADELDKGRVAKIDYTAYEEMANEGMMKLKEEFITSYGLNCLHVFHSLGKVAIGEICLFVLTSAPHRKQAIEACSNLVERIKNDLPIWGKEIIGESEFQWKENK